MRVQTDEVVELDLGDALGLGLIRTLAGKPIGVASRRHLHLDALDRVAGPIRVVVPRTVVTVTASFAFGLFEPSIRHLGGMVGFRSHYHLIADSDLLEEIERGLAMAARYNSRKADAKGMARFRSLLRGLRCWPRPKRS